MSDQYITTDDYAYKDQPLTPTIIESLILETFSGQLQKRDVMVKVILRLHLDRGGMATQVIDLPRSFKKALERLQKQGLADNPSYGYWRVTRGAGTSDVQVEVETAIAIPASSMLSAELIIGEGEGVVYLYYFPTYRTQAEEHNTNIWPCKIGRTEREPLLRVLSQASTALPERPIIALLIHTPSPLAWEAALHGVLTLRGRKIETAPGSEWFSTSPSEVIELARCFDSSLGNT